MGDISKLNLSTVVVDKALDFGPNGANPDLSADMTEDQIRETIAKVLAELGIEAPTAKDKGKIMKSLMPLVKGKADGKIVKEILAGFMK